MNGDLRRLCDAALKASLSTMSVNSDGKAVPDSEVIVLAVLEALQRPSDEAVEAMAEALAKPRMHVNHRASDNVQAALIGYHALLNHILGRRTS